jgi:hypothetical protein
MRHTAALHARQEVYATAALPEEPGYVEPDPPFFEMLGNLADEWHRAFDERKTFAIDASTALTAMRADLQALADSGPFNNRDFLTPRAVVAARFEYAPWPKDLQPPQWTAELAQATLERAAERSPTVVPASPLLEPINVLQYFASGTVFDQEVDKAHAEFDAKQQAWRIRVAAWLDAQTAATLPTSFVTHFSAERQKLQTRWRGFLTLCLQLQAMAHKQLRRQPLSDAQRHYILSYGATLGHLMGYDGSTYLMPRDDAPVCSPILHDPQSGLRRHAGLGRPRIFYILYPTPGGEVLLQGAVNTYEERDSPTPLTDTAWRELLDEKPQPPEPWLRPISPGPTRVPADSDR